MNFKSASAEYTCVTRACTTVDVASGLTYYTEQLPPTYYFTPLRFFTFLEIPTRRMSQGRSSPAAPAYLQHQGQQPARTTRPLNEKRTRLPPNREPCGDGTLYDKMDTRERQYGHVLALPWRGMRVFLERVGRLSTASYHRFVYELCTVEDEML